MPQPVPAKTTPPAKPAPASTSEKAEAPRLCFFFVSFFLVINVSLLLVITLVLFV